MTNNEIINAFKSNVRENCVAQFEFKNDNSKYFIEIAKNIYLANDVECDTVWMIEGKPQVKPGDLEHYPYFTFKNCKYIASLEYNKNIGYVIQKMVGDEWVEFVAMKEF